MSTFVRGLAYGFAIAAPVGPIGMLCIRRSIEFGRIDGLVTGLGAASADAFYGAVAAFGLTSISDSLTHHTFALHIAGGIVLIAFGAHAFRARPRAIQDQPTGARRITEYGSTVLLTLANPTTIFSFAAAYVAVGVPKSNRGAAWFVLGVFAGSALWWVILSASASALGRRLAGKRIAFLNRASGAALAGFGIAALVTAR